MSGLRFVELVYNYQSFSQSLNQSITHSHLLTRSIDRSINQPTNQSVSQSIRCFKLWNYWSGPAALRVHRVQRVVVLQVKVVILRVVKLMRSLYTIGSCSQTQSGMLIDCQEIIVQKHEYLLIMSFKHVKQIIVKQLITCAFVLYMCFVPGDRFAWYMEWTRYNKLDCVCP